jgi:hypothetical protein
MSESEQQLGRVKELILPLSQLRLWWRPADQMWRFVEGAYAQNAEFLAATEAAWTVWSGAARGELTSFIQAEAYERERSWWLAFGEVTADGAQPVVTLTDGTRPPIYRLGPLFAAEWVSTPQQATTTRGTLINTTEFHRPARMVAGDRYKNLPT